VGPRADLDAVVKKKIPSPAETQTTEPGPKEINLSAELYSKLF
jgi:hypothetical protein